MPQIRPRIISAGMAFANHVNRGKIFFEFLVGNVDSPIKSSDKSPTLVRRKYVFKYVFIFIPKDKLFE